MFVGTYIGNKNQSKAMLSAYTNTSHFTLSYSLLIQDTWRYLKVWRLSLCRCWSVTAAAPPSIGYFKQKHGRVRPVVIVNPSRKCDRDGFRADTGLPGGCGRGLRKFGGDGVASYLLRRLPFRQTPQGTKGTWHPHMVLSSNRCYFSLIKSFFTVISKHKLVQ